MLPATVYDELAPFIELLYCTTGAALPWSIEESKLLLFGFLEFVFKPPSSLFIVALLLKELAKGGFVTNSL